MFSRIYFEKVFTSHLKMGATEKARNCKVQVTVIVAKHKRNLK